MTDTTLETPTDAPEPPTPTRRQVLLTSGVVAAAAAVTAACGSSSSSGTNATPTSGGAGTASSSAPEASTPAASSSAPAAAGDLATADVPVGGGVVIQDKKVVVTQPTAGEFKAFTAVCTHQGCLVASVKDGTITCPCHGSQFSATDGSVKAGPAPAGLAEAKITVSGSSITIG